MQRVFFFQAAVVAVIAFGQQQPGPVNNLFYLRLQIYIHMYYKDVKYWLNGSTFCVAN